MIAAADSGLREQIAEPVLVVSDRAAAGRALDKVSVVPVSISATRADHREALLLVHCRHAPSLRLRP